MTATPGTQIRGYRYVIGAMSIAAHLAVGLNLFAVSPLLPLAVDDYGINGATAGLLVSMPMLMAAAFGLPGGLLVARMGLSRSFLLGWAAVAVLALSAVTDSFPVLLVLRLVYGLGFALLITATGPILMHWFRPKELLVMNALNTAFISLGIAVSVAAAAPLSEIMHWRETLAVFGLTGVAGTVLWAVFGRESSTASSEPPPGTRRASRGISIRDAGGLLRNRAVLLLVAADAGVLVQYTAFTGWLPTFYNEERGISLAQAGFITGILPFVGIFAVLAGGVLPLRIRSPRPVLAASGILAGLGGLGAFLLADLPLIYAAVVVMGIGSWLYVPTLLTVPMQLSGMTPERVAVVWGCILTVSGFAMFGAPVLVGGLRDVSGSFLPGFVVCTVICWTLFLAGVFYPRSELGARAVVPAPTGQD